MTRPQTSATNRAIRLVNKHGYTILQAAKKCGVARSTIYRALARKSNKEG